MEQPPDLIRGEHRLFSFITQNWRAKPLVSYRVIVELIGATTTQTGLTVRCELDDKTYSKGLQVSDEQMNSLNIREMISTVNGITRSPHHQPRRLKRLFPDRP